jgi:heptosyltransferase II
MKRQGILIVQSAFLGDLILTLPLVTLLGKAVAEPIGVVARVGAGELLRDVPTVNHLHLWDRSKGLGELFRVIREVKAQNYNIALIPHRILKAAFIPFWARIPHRVGFSHYPGWWLSTNLVPYHRPSHEVQRALSLAQPLGIPLTELSYGIKPALEIVEKVKGDLKSAGWKNQPIIIVAPGSFWATKTWTAEGFAAVAEHYAGSGFLPVLVGSVAETKDTAELLAQKGIAYADMGGKTDIRELAALVSLGDLLVSNDSAPAHLGAAFNIPTVAVFCGTSPDLGFAPFSPRAQAVWGGAKCSPCGRTGRKTCCNGTWDCQDKVKPELVIETLQQTARKIVPTARHHHLTEESKLDA